ncbi:MAG: hypothetical protein QOG57_3354, partial [Pseudonocardiales bacterium]|nr:hypothetical protein [Pseudonocardiales bacterium]
MTDPDTVTAANSAESSPANSGAENSPAEPATPSSATEETEAPAGTPAGDRRPLARVLGLLTNADRVQNLILLAVIVIIAAFVTSRQPAFL